MTRHSKVTSALSGTVIGRKDFRQQQMRPNSVEVPVKHKHHNTRAVYNSIGFVYFALRSHDLNSAYLAEKIRYPPCQGLSWEPLRDG